MSEQDRIIFERGIMYEQISKALTQYEKAINSNKDLNNCE